MKKRKKLPLLTRLKDYFVPHERNGHKPHYFRTASLAVLVVGVLALEGAYFAQTQYVFKQTDFLASVLPGVLTALTNDDRQALGLSALSEDAELARIAQKKADDMAAKGYFSHTGPDGKQAWNWLKDNGYEYSYAGENLAVNFTDSKEVEEAWMNSPTHKANIVKGTYTRVGIGVANGTYEGKDATFVVQLFATPPAAKAAPVAVAAKPAPVVAPVPEEPAPVLAVEETPETPTVETVPTTTEVLGSETQAPVVSSFNPVTWFATVVTSPSETTTYVLGFILLLTFCALLLTVLIKLHIQHPSVIMAGLMLLALYGGALYINSENTSTAQVPANGQAATVFNAIGN